MLAHFTVQDQQITFVNIASSLSERGIGKLSTAQGQLQVLHNFYTSLKAQTLSLMTNTEVTVLLPLIFEKISAKYSSL